MYKSGNLSIGAPKCLWTLFWELQTAYSKASNSPRSEAAEKSKSLYQGYPQLCKQGSFN